MKHTVLAASICVALYVLLFAVSRCAANAQTKEVIVNVPSGVEISEAGCDAFTKITGTANSKGGVRLNVQWETGKFDEVRVKFVTDDWGVLHLLYIERYVVNGKPFTVDLEFPQRGLDYKVHTRVEGYVGSDLKAFCTLMLEAHS